MKRRRHPSAKDRKTNKFRLESLERRVLFSADLPFLTDGLAMTAANDPVTVENLNNDEVTPSQEAVESRVELVIIDASTPAYEQIIADLSENSDANYEIHVLDADQDGISQISQILSEYDNVGGLHIISHGSDGEINLGDGPVGLVDLLNHADEVAGWQDSFAESGDLLIYGCDLAATESGQNFVTTLGQLTGTDVAASDDLTGSAELGGDWQLEFATGSVETDLAVSAQLQDSYDHVLATYTVTNLNDSGAGSLRQAIADANGNSGDDRIEFAVAGTISLSSVLPDIADKVDIDGSTAPGYAGTPLITLDGSSAGSGNGLTFIAGSDGGSVRGLAINQFQDAGIKLINADGLYIKGNHIGTDATGTVDLGNGGKGIDIQNSASITIGGSTAADRNVISGNGNDGIILWGSASINNTIQGNYIGVDASGDVALGNGGDGVSISGGANGNTIGGDRTLGEGNVLSGNSGGNSDGIEIGNAGADNNKIYGNYIGTNQDGSSAIANARHGVVIYDGVQGTEIGGTATGEGNIISGNTSRGIVIDGNGVASTSGNLIRANIIGLDATGTVSIFNGSDGIQIFGGAQSNTIGGTTLAERNIISGNLGSGIYVTGANTNLNTILGNSIYANNDLGINMLGGTEDGFDVTANDAGDGDTGANNLQNFPVLSTAGTTGSQITIAGSLNSTANSYYRIEFFTSTSGDASGNGGAETYLGFANVATDGSGNAVIDAVLTASVADGAIITATATKSDATYSSFTDTSEFAANINASLAVSLWLTTEEDVGSPSGANGLDSWTGGSVLSFDDPNLAYDPGGTNGTFSNVFNLDDFVQDGDSRIDAIHYVGTNMTVGSNAIPLQAGDILLSSVFAETLVNSDASTLSVTSRDAFIFRPDDVSDHSLGGTFILLINGADLGYEIEGITLVEQTTTVGVGGGATTLNPGDLLMTDRGSNGVIYRFEPGVLGDGATNTGTRTVLVDGIDLGINQLVHGVELVESDVTIGDRTLTSGQILVSLYSDDTVAGTAVSRSDIFILNVTDTGTATTATAEALFTGTDVGLDTWQESPWAMSLLPSEIPNSTPTAANNTVITNEDTTYVFAGADFNFSDADAGDTLQQVMITSLPGNGTLRLSGVDVTLNQVIGVADIDAGNLTFTPAAEQSGSGYDSFDFKVSDGEPIGSAGTVLNSFPAGAVVNSMSGLAFDGTGLWLTSPNTDTIYNYDTAGNLLTSFAAPGTYPTGITFDGTNLWVVDRDDNMVYEIDTLGNVQSSFATPGTDSRGLTWDGSSLWLVEGTGSSIYELSTTGTVLSSFAWPDDYMRDITWNGTSLWVADSNDQQIIEIDTSGTVLSSFASPNTGATGFTFDGTDFWHADADADTVYQLSGATSTEYSVLAYTMTIDVTPINDDPTVTSSATFNVAENSTAVGTVTSADIDGGAPQYTLVGGVDDGLFSIDVNTGVLSFIVAPDFEAPADVGGNNVYNLTVQVDDGNGGVATQNIDVTVTNVLELVVTNTNATGSGSLHQAILDANANVGVTDTITFNIGGGGPQTINVDAAGLPTITDSIILDATSQPGYSGTPLITLDGSATPASSGINGITIHANDSTVKGFIVINFADEGIEIDGSTGFGDNNTVQNNWVGIDKDGNVAGVAEHGIMVVVDATGNLIGGSGANEGNVVAGNGFSGIILWQNADNNIVEGNIVGLKADGTTPAGNGQHGIVVETSSDNNRIGGTFAGAGNIISGNTQYGIHLDGATNATHTTAITGTLIQGNYIGTDSSGTVARGNGNAGIYVEAGATNNTIGGSVVNAGNLISGNTDGIFLRDAATIGNVIQGNLIGTDATGTADLGNSDRGIQIESGASFNIIGGTTAEARNIISGNDNDGIVIADFDGFGTTGNVVQGNYIGSDITGTLALGNSAHGVHITTPSNNTIGGDQAGAGNLIAFNSWTGVLVQNASATGNSILGNVIHSQGGRGIDLGDDGVTSNDLGDGDSGSNNLQNYPLLTNAATDGSTTITIDGTLGTTPSTTYRIEFFASTAQDGTGNGEAERYLGFATITTDGSGAATFSEVLSATVAVGEYVTATATVDLGGGNYGDTSEFAANILSVSTNTAPTTTGIADVVLNEDPGFSLIDLNAIFNDAEDPDTALTYAVVANTDPSLFDSVSINGSGTLTMDYAADRNGSSDLTIRATDTGGLFVETMFTVTLNAVNDEPIRTAGAVNDLVVLEDSGFTSLGLGGISYAPGGGSDESGQTLAYEVTVIPDSNFFGKIYLADGTTQVSTGFYSLTDVQGMQFAPEPDANGGPSFFAFRITDSGGTANGGDDVLTETIQLDITPVNDDPSVTSTATFNVAENSTTVGTVTSSDIDGGAPQYTLVGGVDDGLFSIDINTGALTFDAAPDFEAAADVGTDNVYDLTVQVDDGNGGVVTQNVAVTVTDVNETPVSAVSDADGSPDTVSESAGIGTSVGITAFADDTDLSDTVTYTLDDDAGGRFDIDLNTGVVTVNAALDYEASTSHNITVRATSTDGSSTTLLFNIAIGDVNDTAPVVTASQTFNVNEDAVLNDPVGTVLATDADTVGSLQNWSIVGGNTDGIFQINAASGAITIADPSNLNFEVINQYTLTVQVDDGVNTSATETVVIDINDVNEAPVFTSAPVIGATEGAAYSYTITTNDVDGDAVTITDVTLPAWLTLVDNGDGTATLSGTPTNAEVGGHTVELQVSDGSLTGTQNFTVTVANVNDDPVFSSPAAFNVAENSTVVGNVTTTDVDGGAPQYTLVGADDDGLFSIDINTGALTFDAAPDFEAPADIGGNNVYDVTVQVDDGNGGIVTQNVAVTVTNLNEAPVSAVADTDGASDTVDEDAAIGAAVGITAFANDPDAPDSVTYTLDDDASGRFDIDLNTGIVTVNAALDYETATSHNITIRATSTDGSSATQLFNIAIGDLNDTAPVVTPGQTFNVNEDAALNAVVGTVLATDPDSVGAIQGWSIVGGNTDGIFAINAASGQVTIGDPTNLDFETTNQYTLTVQAGDGSNVSATETIVIDINDINEAPVFTSAPATAATEDLFYSYTITTNDVDGDAVTLTDVTLPAWLTLVDNGDGTATLSGTPTNAEVGGHTIELQVSDGTLTAAQNFTLTVANTNDDPIFTSSNAFNLLENSTAVGTVTTTDVDGGAPQYTLVGAADDGLFNVDINTGALSFNAAPDFESPADGGGDNVYNVTVQVDDGAGGVVIQNVAITVTNVDEFDVTAIIDSDATADTVSESASIGDSVGITASATDADTPDTVTYTLDDDASGLFAIDLNTGVVTVSGALDYEAATSHNITVRATSTDGSFRTLIYSVSVSDENDTAPVVTPGQTFNVNEDAGVNDPVGTVVATDADTIGAFQGWSIVGGNTDGIFQINAATGAITIADSSNLNFEASNQYTLTVQVGDGSNVSAAETVVIDINDVNEAPTFTSAPVTAATEDVAYSYLITTNDQDSNPLSITDISLPAWLTLVDNGDGTATLSGNPTNAEVGPHSITLQVSDGSLTSDQNFTLTVANTNDDPVFTSANAFNVAENSTTVGTVTTADVDGGAPQYSLVGVVDDGLFNIDANTGALTFAAAPNFESPADVGGDNVYNLTVQVDDGAGGIVTQNVSVTVSNINEFATSAITDADGLADAVNEDAGVGAVVGITASADDADAPDTVTYTLDDDAGGLFEIDLNSGVVTVSAALDYESATSHNITVRASSTDGSSATQIFTIAIGDVNDNPPVVTPAQTFSINEDAAINDVVGTVLATDQDTVGSLQGWSIVGGNADGIFQIDAATGVISIADPTNLNFESTNQYTLTVQVGDGSNTSASESVVIDVNDVNEAPTFTSAPLTAATEDLLYSYTITTNDVDGDALTITDVTLPVWLTLVDNGDGTATLSGTPSNAEVGPHSIELQVSDGALTSTQNFMLTVTNTNDDPVFTSSSTFVLAENIASVGTVTTADVDGGAPQYTIVGAADDGLFSIDLNSGALSFNAAPDYDAPADMDGDNIYQVTVQVDDGAGGVVTQNISVSITNIDEFDTTAVTDSDAVADSISEDASIGSTVGITAFADDADTPDSISYTLDDDAGGRFDIDANIGVVTLNASLDYELASSHNITVRAVSTDGSSSLQVFTIAVGDVNDTLPVITPAQTFNINEDAALNDVLGTVLASDQDTVGSLQDWTIVSGNTDGVFQIDAATGAISIADASNLNFESMNQYTLTIQVGDGVNLSATETVVVDINDVNEAPTFVSAPATSATEDLPYSYTITTNDVDGDALTITDVTLPAWLTLIDNGDGTATLSGTPTNAEVGAHAIELQVSDGSLAGTQNFTLTVGNVNDAPVFTSPTAYSVAENTSAVGSVTSSDVDGGAAQYTLVGALDDGLFSVDINTGALSFTLAPDFDSPMDAGGDNVYNLTIQVDDGAGGVVTQNVAVTVTNINEHAASPVSDTDATADVIAEDAAIGSIVGYTAFADDADAPDSITYSLDDDAGGRFTIDSLSGVVTVNAALDYEAATNHNITVRATSTDGSSSTVVVNLAVADVNEGPQLLDLTGNAVDEGIDASAGYAVGQLTAADPDAGDALTYSVIGGLDASAFSIGGPQGDALILTVGSLDFETQSSYEVQVRVTDANGLFTDRTFTVTVNDLNDAPQAVADTLQTLEDTALQINVAADLLANDSDQDGDSVSLVSVSQPARGILIDNLDGTWTYLPDANFNGADQFQYQISDGNGAVHAATVDIQVLSVNDAPQLLAPASLSVNENTVGQVVQVQGTDVDNEPLSLSISGGADAAAFQLDASSGALTFAAGADYESPTDSNADNRYELELTVTDGSGASSTQQLQIAVTNINEAPSLAPANFVSGEAFTGAIGAVETSDPDSGDSLTLTVIGGNAQAAFDIDPVTGEIVQSNPVAAGVYTLEVQVADAAGATSTGTLTISINAKEALIVGSSVSNPVESIVAEADAQVSGALKSFDSASSAETSAVQSDEAAPVAAAETEASAEVPNGTGSTHSEAAFAAQAELDLPAVGHIDHQALPSSAGNVVRGYEMLLEILFEEAEEGAALFKALADTAQSTLVSATLSPSMLGALDAMRTDLDEQQRDAEEELQLVVKSGTVATLSLTAGFVTWLLRTGSLLATALSTSPLWRTLDPIPVLAVLDDDDEQDLTEERS